MSRRMLIAMLSLLMVVAAACGGGSSVAAPAPTPTPTPTPTTFKMIGGVEVSAGSDLKIGKKGGYCAQTTYPDITLGAAVTVTDATSAVVALGTLDGGVISDTFESGGESYVFKCVYTFTIPDVPLGPAFFGVEVSNRGVVRFPKATASNPVLTLGQGTPTQ